MPFLPQCCSKATSYGQIQWNDDCHLFQASKSQYPKYSVIVGCIILYSAYLSFTVLAICVVVVLCESDPFYVFCRCCCRRRRACAFFYSAPAIKRYETDGWNKLEFIVCNLSLVSGIIENPPNKIQNDKRDGKKSCTQQYQSNNSWRNFRNATRRDEKVSNLKRLAYSRQSMNDN